MHIFSRSLLATCMSASVLALGAGTFKFLTKNPRQPDLAVYAESLPAVRTIIAQPQQISLPVSSQGIVAAEQSTTVSAQVGGRIIEVSPDLKPGLAVKEGQLLLQIEPDDYLAARSLAKAQLAEAEATLASEQARSIQARRDWERLGKTDEASPLNLREPQLASAIAAVLAAQAASDKAQLDLDRTGITAPYDAKVVARFVDLGSTVAPGSPVAEMFSTSLFEVRLPLSLDDLAFVAGDGDPEGSKVFLSVSAAGITHSWEATIVRIEAMIDRQSRSTHLVASLPPEYSPGSILQPGLFVTAEIEGRKLDAVYRVPRSAFADLDKVYVVDPEDRLRIRKVIILRDVGEDVLVSAGLYPGERLCLTRIPSPVEGMKVEVISGEEGADAAVSTTPPSSTGQF
jgi:RND family efflux transporter MFP subunit